MSHLNNIILWIFSALGAVTAVVQILKWVRGRRADRGMEEFYESVADRKDTKAARAELQNLKQNLRDLRTIAPAMAKRLHLEQRKRDLENTLGSAWDEYLELCRELGDSAPSMRLPADLIDILQSDIEPRYRAEQRSRRRVTLLLVLMAAALLLPAPFTPRSLLYLIALLFFAVLTIPAGMGKLAYLCGPTMTFVGLALGLAAGFWALRLWQVSLPRRPVIIGIIATGAVVICGNGLSAWATLTALNYGEGGDFHPAIVLNSIDCLLAAAIGCCLVLGRLRPWTPVWRFTSTTGIGRRNTGASTE